MVKININGEKTVFFHEHFKFLRTMTIEIFSKSMITLLKHMTTKETCFFRMFLKKHTKDMLRKKKYVRKMSLMYERKK